VNLRIEALAAHPGFVPTVAAWIYEEWWTQVAGATAATMTAMLRENLAKPPPPLTLVARDGTRPLGTVSLLAHDVGTHRWASLSPWLAALYVVPSARCLGIGAALLATACAESAAFGAQRLHLLTTNQEPFYARRGWQRLDRHEGAVVMAIDVARR
jgi:predicted N-acetyltransferase YhbS